MYNLGRKLGYSLVYQESYGANLFFVRDDVLQSIKIKFKNQNDVSKLYNFSNCSIKVSLDPKIVFEHFISSEDILK